MSARGNRGACVWATLMAITGCSAAGGEDRATAEVQMTSQSAHGPEIVALVKNTASEGQSLLITASTDLSDRCSTLAKPSPPWPDPFLAFGASVRLDPGAWMALIRPTQLAQKTADSCSGRVEVYVRDAAGEPSERALIDEQFKLHFPVRRESVATTSGAYSVSASVMAIEFGSSLRTHDNESILQIQTRVSNRSNNWRDVAIVDRSISCADSANVRWVTGPGELPQGLQAGPAPLTPRGWIVFTQRLRVQGAVAKCTVRFSLAEWIYDEYGVRADWRTFESIDIPLVASGKLTYLTPH